MSEDGVGRLWSCIDCGGCVSFCDHGNDVPAVMAAARAELVADGAVPKEVDGVLASMRDAGRLPDRPTTDEVGPLLESDEGASTLLFLGCQNGRDDLETAKRALALARRHFGAVRVMQGPITCCGNPLWRWGDRGAFAEHARAVARQWGRPERIVVDDPECAKVLRERYPEVGVAVPEVVTLRSLLVGARVQAPDGEVLAPLEGCGAVRGGGLKSLRGLLQGQVALAPGSILEGSAGCCGGMLLPFYDKQLAHKVAKQAADDLMVGATGIVTDSPTCRRRLRAVGANVIDVLSLIEAD